MFLYIQSWLQIFLTKQSLDADDVRNKGSYAIWKNCCKTRKKGCEFKTEQVTKTALFISISQTGYPKSH